MMPAYVISSLFLTGLIWFVQVVHYPLFAHVKDQSGTYFRLHAAKTTYVVALPMLVQLTCAVWFGLNPEPWNALLMRGLLGIVVLVWLLTFLTSVPQHKILANGYDVSAIRKLVATNWPRTILWSGHAGVLVWMLFQRIEKV